MSEDRDQDVQDWFKRSVEELSRQPFTQAVLATVQRRERPLQLLRYAALLLACISFSLLLPQLFVLLNLLAALPELVFAAGSELLLLLAMPVAGLTYWFIRMPQPLRWLAARLY